MRLKNNLQSLKELMKSASAALFTGKIGVDPQVELLAWLRSIDAGSTETDIRSFRNSGLIEILIRKLTEINDPFETKEMYDKAQKVLFALLKKGIVEQTYNETNQKMNIHLK